MKLTSFILLLSLMQVSAITFGQKITLTKKRASIENIFYYIKKQTGYGVFVAIKEFDINKKIDVKFIAAPLEQVFEELIGDNFSFTIEDKMVVIRKKQKSLFDNILNYLKAIDVRGTVVDEKGQPIAGAIVKLVDGSKATITDAAGIFSITKVAEDQKIIVSFLGYKSKEVVVSKDWQKISLEISNSVLDEVKIMAYGQTSQRFDLGNIISIKSENIERQNVTNPLLALQGQVPGLIITQSTGFANGGVTVRIQGQNSINQGQEPFYVIDGVPYSNLQTLTNSSLTGGMSPLAFINPNDIESISVLKDASATAIYGSQAANGAIVITTKKGKNGPVQIQFNLNQGGNLPSKQIPMLNTQQYIQMRREAYMRGGAAIPGDAYDVNGFLDTDRNTDWQSKLIGNAQNYTNANISISGGSEITHYNISGTFIQTTIPTPSSSRFNDNKGNLHFNIGSTSLNKKFNVSLTGGYMQDENRLPNWNPAEAAVRLPPNAPSLYNADGSINWAPLPTGASVWNFLGVTANPVGNLLTKYSISTRNLLSDLQLSYEIQKGLVASIHGGYNELSNEEYSSTPLSSVPQEERAFRTNGASWGNTSNFTWILEPLMTYRKLWGKHDLLFTAGGTFRKSGNRQSSYSGIDFPSDEVMNNILLAKQNFFGAPQESLYKYAAIFSRFNYRYRDEILIEGSLRRDGSSRFGDYNKFHSFYGIGFGWIFTERPIFKNQLNWLSYGKLKSNYGTTGSDQLNDYTYLNRYSAYSANLPYAGLNALSSSGLSNPYLQWEETRKLNIGLELGFLNDRILFNGNFYRNRSSNQLLTMFLPYVTGFNSIQTNIDAVVQNSGIEMILSAKILDKDKFKWNAGLNFGINRNKLLKFENIQNTPYKGYTVGKSLSFFKLYDYQGVNPQTGLYQFLKLDGTLTSQPVFEDANFYKEAGQRWSGGISNTISYKNLNLHFLMQVAKQLNPDWTRGLYTPGAMVMNQPNTVLSRWQNVGDVSDVQRFDISPEARDAFDAMQYSTGGYIDATYLRLKTLSLSWDIPTRKVFKRMQLNAQAQNLFTISDYLGDPETGDWAKLSGLKTFTIGIKTTF
ncbi:SusC/RagA family TonB-linked outer membrane protein [Pedobacter paludis]|nr:SusC/RagA family TonB-linked outer membrane protein [Pedobacter paludis]